MLFGRDFWRLTRRAPAAGVRVAGGAASWSACRWACSRAKLPRVDAGGAGAVGVIQTIPSLALFAFLIALLGTIGTVPALIALFLYALLPIVRNTHAGLAAGRARACARRRWRSA